ncbi:hypothetical protein ACRSLK_14510 [Halopseudomonas pachastrellae]|uniref:hypothetical protein n=1 Tax=Halopseudomonas pachastrellae TaxID=254161 RepID=UPI003D7D7AE2
MPSLSPSLQSVTRTLRAQHLCTLTLLTASLPVQADPAFMQRWVEQFADSEIVFQRGSTNVPFQPLAFVDATHYGESTLERADGSSVSARQTTLSQGAVLPFLMSPRDALLVGDWVSWSHFDSTSSNLDSFDVLSVGVPVGWFRQVNDRWQAGGFVMPLGHKASGEHWSWETMTGGFARYVQNDRLWWAFGLYADFSPGDNLYLPYVGASYALNERWTLSAVMPWPAVLYAPDSHTLYRLGVSPSGASWSTKTGTSDIQYELDTWDFGFSAARRLQGNLWLEGEVGVTGLTGMSLRGSDWEEPDFDVSNSPYISIGINFRPSL